MDRLMGIENEFAFRATGPRGGQVEGLRAVQEINEIAAAELPCLPSLSGAGIFLGNGCRLYIDSGGHQEMASPESANPWDVVRYLCAGEQILLRLAEKLVQRRRLSAAIFYKCNVDYTTGCSWGCHENYGHKANPDDLPEDLVPFLTSRLILTGAGGFDPLAPLACRFMLSPRACHISQTISNNSTQDRGIYHTKDEPLCNKGNHRLHVLVGESLCSHTGNWLKFATTGLVVALAEAGIRAGRSVSLRNPVEALRAFACDPTLKQSATTSAGGSITAWEIQDHYLQLARRHLLASFMPAWAPRAVAEWQSMLQRLQSNPHSAGTRLDWAIKHQMYTAHIAKRGFTWKLLEDWSCLLELLNTCSRQAERPGFSPPMTAEYFNRLVCPLKHVIRELQPHMDRRGMHWAQMEKFQKLRLELFEIDTRFGELGSTGLFNALDRAGVLQHQFPGVDNIEHAIHNPPAIGRAKIRGQIIQRLQHMRNRFACDWSSIVDTETHASLDLRDPWTSTENWTNGLIADNDQFPFPRRVRSERAASAGDAVW